MSTVSNLRVSYSPRVGVSPRALLSPYAGSPVGIPVIELAGEYDRETLEVSLGHDELDDAVRYLRELAEQASRLVDEIEQRRSES